MATLCIDIGFEGRATPELHDWLGGDWGMLFSHPQDFQYHGRDEERHLSVLREQFRASGVRPIAVQFDDTFRDTGWVGELLSDYGLVRLREPAVADRDTVSSAARSLYGELLTLQPKYVLMVDGDLKHRAVLRYNSSYCNVSPLELLESIDSQRRRVETRRAA